MHLGVLEKRLGHCKVRESTEMSPLELSNISSDNGSCQPCSGPRRASDQLHKLQQILFCYSYNIFLSTLDSSKKLSSVLETSLSQSRYKTLSVYWFALRQDMGPIQTPLAALTHNYFSQRQQFNQPHATIVSARFVSLYMCALASQH